MANVINLKLREQNSNDNNCICNLILKTMKAQVSIFWQALLAGP
jgi:hypothetical protein